MNLIIYNNLNSQKITLTGLLDDTGTPVAAATVTATLTRNGVTLAGSSLTFEAVDATPGNYSAILLDFDAPAGPAQMMVTGVNSGITFNIAVFVTVAIRSM